MESVKLGSRVYYRDAGPSVTGTVVDIVLADDNFCFVVKWDNEKKSEFIEQDFFIEGVMDAPVKVIRNPADENVDRYCGGQLVLVTY